MGVLLIACGALARELIAMRDRHGWDAKILAIPAHLHNRPERIPAAVKKRLEDARQEYPYDHAIIVYGDCGTGGMLDRLLEELDVERIAGPHCYEQYAGADTFAQMMNDELGTYFLTDYIAQSFDHLIIENLGLDRYPELREMYFGNYRRVVYLQQRDDPKLLANARAAADALSLPLEVRFTGYGELETRLLEKINALSGA